MGVDLTLLIVDGRTSANEWFAHTLLEYGRDCALFERLSDARDMGFRLWTYLATIPDGTMKGESGYGEVGETCYGKPLTYVTAAEFLAATEAVPPKWPRTKACVAYIRELDPDTWIGLYYH